MCLVNAMAIDWWSSTCRVNVMLCQVWACVVEVVAEKLVSVVVKKGMERYEVREGERK